jgi:hypothetical protein
MFDQEHPIELVGTVKEFKFTSPHTFVILEVKNGGESVVWNLEGQAPGGLARDGWSAKTLPPGTELRMTIDPLRSGAPGGAWSVQKTKLKDGSPVVATQDFESCCSRSRPHLAHRYRYNARVAVYRGRAAVLLAMSSGRFVRGFGCRRIAGVARAAGPASASRTKP